MQPAPTESSSRPSRSSDSQRSAETPVESNAPTTPQSHPSGKENEPTPRRSQSTRRRPIDSVLDVEVPPMDETEHRLRQLDKVSRIMGEQVPAELILGSAGKLAGMEANGLPQRTSSQKRRLKTLRRRTSISTPAFITNFGKSSRRDMPPNPSLLSPPSAISGDSPGISPIEFSPPEISEPPPNPGLQDADDPSLLPKPASRRSKSLHSTHSKRSGRSDDGDHGMSSPDAPSFDIPYRESTSNVGWVQDGRGHVFRSEQKQGWMGAWNQQDMGDVISKLRNLK